MKKIAFFIVVFMLVLGIKNNISSITSLSGNTKVIGDLKNQLDQSKQENGFLAEKLSYVQSNDYVEKEAREKLGLVKTGDYIVVASDAAGIQQSVISWNQKADVPNWKKWLDLFF